MSDGRTWGTVIGGVVGFFTGGIGVAAGAAIGGAVGGLLEPKKHTETNRLDDIKVSLSKYGDGIPETWGNNIPSATCVWSTYIIELPEKQSGGKGGGVENTNYRQFIQSMWCLGRTPPPGTSVVIRKVWIDGKLNYDASSGMSIGQALATEENPWASLALLPGFDEQLPVPMIETYEGIGNVPAFLGRICVFIFGLECPGGRVPQLQFELCIGAEIVQVHSTFADFISGETGFIEADAVWHLDSIDNGADVAGTLDVYRGDSFASSLVRSIALTPDGNISPCTPVTGALTPTAVRSRWHYVGSDYGVTVDLIDLEAGTIQVLFQDTLISPALIGYTEPLGAAYDPVSGKYVVLGGSGAHRYCPFIISGGSGLLCDFLPYARGVVGFYENAVYAVTASPVGLYEAFVFDGSSGLLVNSIPGPTVSGVGDARAAMIRAGADGVFAWVKAGTGARIYRIDVATSAWVLVSDDTDTRDSPKTESERTMFYTNGNIAIVGPSSTGKTYDFIRFNVVQPGEPAVADFIESQSLRAGLSVEQIDVSAVDDNFWGLTLKSPASARSNIGPLMTYAAIGVVEEDGLLRYFRRADKTSVVTIPYGDLGFAEDGNEPGDPFPLVRRNSQELPKSLTLTYNDKNFDYQSSTVKAFFPSVGEGAEDSITLDMATDGDHALTICRRILLERRISQITRSLAVSREYAYLSAGDVITVLSKGGSYGDFMTSKISDTGARIEIECFPADSDLLIQTVPGPSGYRAQEIEPLAPSTRVLPIDTSILQDSDDNAGLYVAMSSYAAAYPGGELFVGDEDPPGGSVGTVTSQAPLGSTETLLGDFTQNIVDESNLLIVTVGLFALANVTRAVLLSNGSENVAAVGRPGRWEIIKFQRADSLGPGRYVLSGLLRGLRGTEWARGLHQPGDDFVLLGLGGILRPNLNTASIGQTKYYRGVTLGRGFNSVASIPYANTAEGLKPFSPVDIRRAFSGNDIVFTWHRRTRFSENVLAGIFPLGEVSERYVLELCTDGTFASVIRTFEVTSETATYTEAMQNFDSYVSGPLHPRVVQISDSVGRGHALEATL